MLHINISLCIVLDVGKCKVYAHSKISNKYGTTCTRVDKLFHQFDIFNLQARSTPLYDRKRMPTRDTVEMRHGISS